MVRHEELLPISVFFHHRTWNKLKLDKTRFIAMFHRVFGHPPHVVARLGPRRVNLIGEHVDYECYSAGHDCAIRKCDVSETEKVLRILISDED